MLCPRTVGNMSAEIIQKIQKIRQDYGNDICLLAHLYQSKAICELADFMGDSFGLSKSAAQFKGGKYIVFCGVRFMAESAAILCRPEQKVIHPEPEAGCPMADMANLDQVKFAWQQLNQIKAKWIPVTYMNSTADIKAFCGEHDGTICTSSNATQTFDWAFKQGERIFFLPDEHLGRNTALKYGIAPEEIAVWDPHQENDLADFEDAKVVVWKGYCPVHVKFTPRDIETVRKHYPKAQVLVHPECPKEVVELADAVGSTDFIRKYVAKAPAGSEIFIGTEINLIQNLAAEYPDKRISKLHRSLCLTMYQITLEKLLYALENIKTFETVELPDSVKHFSRIALDRMLTIS